MPKKIAAIKRESVKTKPVLTVPKKIISPVRIVTNSKPQKVSGTTVEKILVENFVSLQRVMVNLSVKLDNLASQISQLLSLFEISAKSLAEKNIDLGGNYEKRMMEKLDNLVDQNKTIARGVSFLHEGEQKQVFSPQPQPQSQQLQRRGLPQEEGAESYQRSISSSPQKINKLPGG